MTTVNLSSSNLLPVIPTVTKTIGGIAAGVVSCPAHGLVAGQVITFSGLVNPVALADNAHYFVVDASQPDSFTFSTTKGGPAETAATADAGGSVGSVFVMPLDGFNGLSEADAVSDVRKLLLGICKASQAWYAAAQKTQSQPKTMRVMGGVAANAENFSFVFTGAVNVTLATE